ncbi:hypothetical protein RRG08_039843 [Elysia crispata]|uniref:Uncharacterized protein n=1 Tax=Elysia crispata TaxID=231223 RepID=A0AAE0ZVS2_9GAST|nr:hypothetical protein RRG08_039843 [Elysia crispata]
MGKPWGNCSSHRPWSLQHGALANVRRPSAQIRDELRVHRAGLVGLLVLVTSGVGAELASDQCIQGETHWTFRKTKSSKERKAKSSKERKAKSSKKRKAKSSKERKAKSSKERKAKSSKERKAKSSKERKSKSSKERKAKSSKERKAKWRKEDL